MAIGSELSQYGRGSLRRALGMLFGVLDLHTHLRVRPLIRHLPKLLPSGRVKVMECGCGHGINLFELAKVKANIVSEGYDLNAAAIEHGKLVQRQFFREREIAMHCADATRLPAMRGSYDCVLLMDVLEHIEDDATFAKWVMGALKDGGVLCVSVPTRKYSRVFGEEFHREVGHVREGYSASELAQLFSGMEVAGFWYNTGLLSQLGCRFYYRQVRKLRPGIVRGIMSFACRTLFAYPDWLNGPERSCSLFAIFRNPAGCN